MEQATFLTFDCYGTLVDFDVYGAALRTLGSRLDGINLDDFKRDYAEIRFQEVLGEYRPYREVLRESLRKAMTQYGLTYGPEDGDAIIAEVPTFGPFPDVPGVLEQLRQKYRLVIISNTEDDLIASNVENIGVPFDRVITAEQAGAYKPAHAAFHYMLDQLGCDADDLIHIAQGFKYDIMPASELGWRKIWINRNGEPGDQNTYGPYEEMPDMTGLPALLGI